MSPHIALAALWASVLIAPASPTWADARRFSLADAAAADGEWRYVPVTFNYPPARAWHSAIHDSLADRLVVFGGEYGFLKNDVFELPLSGPPIWRITSVGGALPAPRSSHTATYDPVRQRMIVYGGRSGSGDFGDLWALSLSGSPSWTQLFPAGPTPPGRAHHTMIYDPIRDRMLLFGGFDYATSTRLNDVWALDLSGSLQWSPIAPAGTAPAPRYGHGAVYDPVRDRMVIHGGAGSFDPFWEVHALTLSGTPTWSLVPHAGPYIPAGRRYHACVYDRAHDAIVIYGGDPNSGSNFTDTWSFHLGTRVWSELPWGPNSRSLIATAWDSRRNRLVIHGGSPQPLQECWAFAMNAYGWSMISPVGPGQSPTARSLHAAAYDPVRDRMLMHGGLGTSGAMWSLALDVDPVWSPLPATGTAPAGSDHQAIHDPVRDRLILLAGTLSLSNVPALSLSGSSPSWSTLAVPQAPTARRRPSAIYDPLRDRILMFGGFEPGGVHFGVTSNELWELTLGATPEWNEIATLGPTPTSRGYHTAVYDAERDRMVVFGGFTSDPNDDVPTPLDDVWELSLSGTPTWSPLSPTGGGPGTMSGHTAVVDAARRLMLVSGSNGGGAQWWSLSLDGPEHWTPIEPSGGPPASRTEHVAVYDEDDHRMAIFGGRDDSATLSDAWELRFASLVDVDPPHASRVALLGARPNPAIGAIRAVFTLPDSRPARLEVFDLAGRRMAHRDVANAGPGLHVLEIPGTERLPAGVYVMRLVRDEDVRTTRVARLR